MGEAGLTSSRPGEAQGQAGRASQAARAASTTGDDAAHRGSDHQWFQDERRHDLIVILDDATSEIYYAQLAPEESTATVMAGLRAVIERKGLFCSLYSDRGAHFWYTPKSAARWIISALRRWAVP